MVEHDSASTARLEDELEYTSVTALRGKLLAVVDSFRKTPAKRYLITKHGQPQAVLMSFETYRLLKRAVARSLPPPSGTDALELGDAIARLRSDREAASPQTLTAEKKTKEMVDEIRRHLDRLETALNKHASSTQLDPNQTSR